jgi:serine/threonine protein kinase
VLADKYELLSKIGEGGFGAVYRARHRELQKTVAVKVLRGTHLNADGAARFRREGINACRVQHANALHVLDFGTADDALAYLVMELLDGHSLEDELRRGWLSFQQCAEILAPVCDVLAHAHAAGVIHRDIKPANIFLHSGPNGLVPKVLDFGIAKLVTSHLLEQQITIEGWIVGTPAYMAPERFGAHVYDGTSDVYSMGVLIHQVIAGVLPFVSSEDHSEPAGLAIKHLHDAPTPLREIEPDTPEALEALVLRALAKAPADRPSAAEVADGLRAAVEGTPEVRSLMRGQREFEGGPTIVSNARIRTSVPTVSMRGEGSEE